jgi:hypothetical protein
MLCLGKRGSGVISFFVVLLLILGSALLMGQILGRFYIGNIQQEQQEQQEKQVKQEKAEMVPKRVSSRSEALTWERNKKKKVLRLKKVEYYTILVAAAEQRDEAVQIGQNLGKQGLPVIVTAEAPYQVLLGFVNNEAKLLSLAERIRIGETAVEVRCEILNKVAFKFEAEDTLAAEKIAPFLGKISLCLEKGLLLYKNITVADEEMILLRPKYALLATALEEAAAEGMRTAAVIESEQLAGELEQLARLCQEWGQSLNQLGTEWSDAVLLRSQQLALVLVEEYHRFLGKSN